MACSPTKSVCDYGAVGDSNTDDGPAFIAALKASAAGAGPVLVPAHTYAIKTPIAFTAAANVGQPWGLIGQGGMLLSKITNGADVLEITSTATVRYLQLSGFKVQGSGTDGNGIHLFCATGTLYLYDNVLESLYVEGCGKDGIVLEGNVFETVVQNTFCQDNKGNGLTCADSKGGDCSSIKLRDCFLMQNGNYGLNCTTFDAQYGGARDVSVIGGYMRDNQSYGAYFNNGVDIPLMAVGFENNCKKLQPNDPNGAHVYSLTDMRMDNCNGYVNYAGSTFLLRGWWSQSCVLNGCTQVAEGPPSLQSDTLLVQLNGSAAGFMLMNQCSGGISYASGNAALWRAVNSIGPSPTGPWNPSGTVGTR